eukprot:tig00020999_g16965.t1
MALADGRAAQIFKNGGLAVLVGDGAEPTVRANRVRDQKMGIQKMSTQVAADALGTIADNRFEKGIAGSFRQVRA